MSADPETKAVYAARAADYKTLVSRPGPDRDLVAFIESLPDGGRILDLGCGPGNSATMMVKAGFAVDATDASPEMAAIARSEFDIRAEVASFAELNAVSLYDGIWANFSLLHAPKSEFLMHLMRIHRALNPGGRLHLGMKLGIGEARDSIGRFYAYYQETELTDLLTAAGFHVLATRRGQSEGLAGGSEAFVIISAHA